MDKLKIHIIRTEDFSLEDFTSLKDFLDSLSSFKNSGIIFKFYPDSITVSKKMIRKYAYDFNKEKVDTFFKSEYFANYFENNSNVKTDILSVLTKDENITNWETLFGLCDQFRERNKEVKGVKHEDQVILLTNINNELNIKEKEIREYFGANDQSKLFDKNRYKRCDNNSFIHTSHWELYLPGIHKIYPISYMVLLLILIRKSGIPFLKFGKENTHETSIGCISDYTNNKTDVILKLRTGDICDSCISKFKINMSNEQIISFLKMLDTIREKVLFNRRALNLNNFATIELKAIESSADEKMKFIKRNIYINHYSDQPLELKGINYTLYLYLLKNRNGFKPKDLKEMDAEIINEMSLIHQNYFGELSKNKAKEEIRNIFTRTTSGDLRIGSIRTRINKYLEKIITTNPDVLRKYQIDDTHYKINLDKKFIKWINGKLIAPY